MPCSDCIPTFTALKKLRECKIMSRLRSNQSPVAFERDQLTEVLSHAQRELVEYNTTIARLHEMIVSLENEKRNLSRQVHMTKSLMAPIRNLPPEILRQIFIEHGRENLIRPRNIVIPGLKITSVCSHWRSIALDTTELWNNISVGWEADSEFPWCSFHVSLVKTLLERSKTSRLSITLDFEPSSNSLAQPFLSGVPTCLPLLCEHANRWQSLAGYCYDPNILDALSTAEGRLHNLDTFRLRCPFLRYRALVKGASTLRTLTTSHMAMQDALTPWNQIVNLEVEQTEPFQILGLLEASPELRTLVVNCFPIQRYDGPVDLERLRHPNLTSLNIVVLGKFSNFSDATRMGRLFEFLDLPNLESLHIASSSENQRGEYTFYWSEERLPSFLLWSSKITTFTLRNIWVPTEDLIVFLQRMPYLTSFSMSDPYFDDPEKSLPFMLNDAFLLSILVHSHQDRQPLLTRLTSLNLESPSLASFSMHAFVDVINSRWKPSYSEDEVTCIRSVKLKIREDCINPAVVHPLAILRERGLDVLIEDEDGDVLARSQIQC